MAQPTFDPDSSDLPSRRNLPPIEGAPEGAAWIWGKNDNLGRLNLLTPRRVASAAKEVKTGDIVSLYLPLDVPRLPAFGREQFTLKIKALAPGLAYDDLYELNTQSGTQWDGFRHAAHSASGYFYNFTRGDDIDGPNPNHKCSIHHWAVHGIAGRGVLLDYRGYAEKIGRKYDAFDYHGISFDDLLACGKDQDINILPASQGGDIQIGDLLFVRGGFVADYYSKTAEELGIAARRPHVYGPDDQQRWAGVKQETKTLDWLHDCWFAAVAGDSPTFEAWPSQTDFYYHEYALPLWGMPLGEMFDLEMLATKCREYHRWTFFVTSAPANCPGGVSSHGNCVAIL